MMAKYLAASLAIENVVSAPRVISNCLPIATISISFVGSLSRSTILPASHAAIGLRQRRGIVGAVAAHRHELAARLLAADQVQLVLGGRLREEIVNPRFGGDRRRGQRIVAGNHDRADAHPAQFGEALADAALDDILQVDDAEQAM